MKKEYSRKILEELKIKFPAVSIKIHSPRRVYIKISKDDAHDLAKFLFTEKKFRFSIATGIDTREGIEILYHFSHDEAGTYYTIKTVVPKDTPRLKSLTDFAPATNWIEREIHELLGVEFVGHPNLVPLLTSDDWPEGVYPMRRDYDDSQSSQ